ncbi:MAG: hypothetical protein AAFR71_07875 [Pseudomonadota bacterium]
MSLGPGKFVIMMLLGASAASGAVISQWSGPVNITEAQKLVPARLKTVCNIKGNISIGSGDKIFHVPGQERYAETIINHRYGERWFCGEAEAYAAGWRKAGR